MQKFSLNLTSPSWFTEIPPFAANTDTTAQMEFVLELVEQNIQHNSGGPFAAALFAEETGVLITAATNRVITDCCSIAHAEMLAIGFAQQHFATHDLASLGKFRLVSSSEPCAMCFGALPWSGISSLVYGASKEDVEAIGFDEGEKPANWQQALEERGINILGGIKREQAAQQLLHYQQMQQPIY